MSHQSSPGISLILPAYNECDSIAQAIREANTALRKLTSDYEILVVDDGSSDATAEIVEELSQEFAGVRLLRQPRQLGYGAALRRGFEAATKHLVAFTDADCQFELSELDRLVMLSRQYDIVCGYRIDRQDRWHRKMYSHVYNVLGQWLLGTGVRDCDCALKVLRREVVQKIPLESQGFFINAELLAKARIEGHSIVEVGVTHRPRIAGRSSVCWRQVFPVGTSLLRFWWRTVLFPQVDVEDRHASHDWPASFRIGAYLLLGLIGWFVLGMRLSYPLIEPDETRYAEIALEMARSGDWVTPTLSGKPYLDKPPLLYWMTAASYQLFGTTEWAARLPCTVSAMLTICCVFGIGSRLVGCRAAFSGAIALLLCCGFALSGRFLLMDGPLTLFTTIGMLAAYRACCGPTLRWGWWLLAGLGCGLGMLTKGPVAAVLIFPPLLASRWLALANSPQEKCLRLRLHHWQVLGIVLLAIVAPWFVAISASHEDFAGYFFWKHHVLRFANTFDHTEPWWYYAPVLLAGMFPTSLLALPLALFLFHRSAAIRRQRTLTHGYLLLAAVWGIGFFSLSNCKLPTYILPLLPPICLLVGSMLNAATWIADREMILSRTLQRIAKPATLLILAMAAASASVDAILPSQGALETVLDAAIVVAIVMLFVSVVRSKGIAPQASWRFVTAIGLVAMTIALADFFPELSRLRSINSVTFDLHERINTGNGQRNGTPVIYFGYEPHAAALHLPPDEIVHFGENQFASLRSVVRDYPRVVIVTQPRHVGCIRSELGDAITLSPAGGRGRIFVTQNRAVPMRIGSKSLVSHW